MIKKFSDFANEKNSAARKPSGGKFISTSKKYRLTEPKTPKKEPPIEPKCQEPKHEEPKLENFKFIGKVAIFPGNIKPSHSLILLENNKISKEKLFYIISEQTPETLVVLKYNQNTKIELTKFTKALIQYYMKNEKLKQLFEKIVVEGTDNYSIIKNIPNILIGEKRLIQIINEDLVKLLKN